jgi:hypothetical protein
MRLIIEPEELKPHLLKHQPLLRHNHVLYLQCQLPRLYDHGIWVIHLRIYIYMPTLNIDMKVCAISHIRLRVSSTLPARNTHPMHTSR